MGGYVGGNGGADGQGEGGVEDTQGYGVGCGDELHGGWGISRNIIFVRRDSLDLKF